MREDSGEVERTAQVHDGERWYHKVFYFCVVNSLRACARVFFFASYKGRKHVPRKGAFLLIANHVSFLDPPMAGLASPVRIHYLARASLFKNRFFGGMIAALGSHPIERGASDRKGLMTAAAVLESGRPMVVFPEGTRSRTGEFQAFQRGFLLLVKKAKCPVIPAWIEGTQKILPPGKKFPGWARIKVRFAEPIPAEEALALGAEGLRQRVLALAPESARG